jgi:nucleoside-diphosphate-sugar epimerase
MATTPSNGLIVLVTGINGYIASCLGLELLKQGYTLRGTARRASSTDTLKEGAYRQYAERFSAYDVPDITVPGAFDEAVKGIDPVMFALVG